MVGEITSDPPIPHEASPVSIEIRQDDAITVLEALTLSELIPLSLGKSTLQRWAKHWYDLGTASPVSCILVTTRYGSSYRLSRSDFEAWAIEQKQNAAAPPEAPRDPTKSREAQQDLGRSHETSSDPVRPDAAHQRGETPDDSQVLRNRVKDLEEENLQLKIDVGVRKQLISQVREEFIALRDKSDVLLRENGALHYQIAQLAAPAARPAIGSAQRHTDSSEPAGESDTQFSPYSPPPNS